jgi:hypothetical protein
MPKKISLNDKALKKYFYYLLIITNIIVLYFMYNFINYYTTETFNTDGQDLVSGTYQKSNNLNTKDFNEIIKNIHKKTETKNFENNIDNIFN